MSLAKVVCTAAKLSNPVYRIAVTAVLIYSLLKKAKNEDNGDVSRINRPHGK